MAEGMVGKGGEGGEGGRCSRCWCWWVPTLWPESSRQVATHFQFTPFHTPRGIEMGVHTLRYTDGRQTAGVSVQYADERDLNWIIDTPLELRTNPHHHLVLLAVITVHT